MSEPLALAPDLAVPQRDLLLDRGAIARRLATELGRGVHIPVRWCRIGCISYRPGKRLRIVYRIGIDGRELPVAASTFRSRSRAERAFRTATETASGAGPLRPVAHAADLDTVFWTFPNDRRIANLGAVAGARDDLTRILDGRWAGSRLVDYYPETSAVIGCLDESNRTIAYAKVQAGAEGERTHRVQAALARLAPATRLRIARPLAYSRRFRTLWVEPIAGTSIGRLSGTRLLQGLNAYGCALATLHSLAPVAGPVRRDALGRLRRQAAGVAMVRPDVEVRVSELLLALNERWAGAAGETVPTHGDTNENNAFLDSGRVALIDFDRASNGAAGSDIGNLLGLLRYFRSLGLISPESERERASAFTSGYASARALPPPECLRVHEAAAVAERAFRAVTRLRRIALASVPALLTEAQELLR